MDTPRIAAVINVGSSSIRLVIAELPENSEIRFLEQAVKFLGLGREVYTSGLIRKKTFLQAIQIFLQYKELLASYGILPSQVRCIGTAALREARNQDNFVDRVEVRTGFHIQVLDGIEENRLSYMAVQYALRDQWAHISKCNSMIAEVGGGSTELILLRRGMICAVHSLNFGTIRLEETYRGSQEGEISPQTLHQNLSTTNKILDDEMKLTSVKTFIAVGNYARQAAEIANIPEVNGCWRVSKSQWLRLTQLIQNLSPEDTMRRYGLPASAVEGFASALQAYYFLLDDTAAEEIVVPKVSFSEGLLVEMGPGVDAEIQSRFLTQVRASALSLGKKFHFDADHARHVAFLALTIFDQMLKDHNLDPHARVLLEVSAILHDIGTYIKPSGHHKHGQYLVENSELFGLSPSDVAIVGNVVRYHRKSTPMPSHPSYMALPRESRLVVLKLASILRVADALDRGHSQKISALVLEKGDEELKFKAVHTGDVAAERFSLADKADLFEEVFGLKPILL
jgi:exopolyphosphatase/guanosine-5'-triphosphate,3'-diphosphate pyrophosphatase